MTDKDIRVITFADGIAVCGTFPNPDILALVSSVCGPLPLIVTDPPYGNIVNREWDKTRLTDVQFCQWMIDWSKDLEKLAVEGSAMYVWGGVGLPRLTGERETPFRPFLRYLVECELQTGWNLSTPITWKKKRAYGIQWGYLFTREECAYFILGKDVRSPRLFKVPLLAQKRGYDGYDKAHPAKSEFLRRTNVWDDVTEILRDKVHINQKPRRLMEIPIEVHTREGEWVLDPFCGSGTTAFAARHLDRKFFVIEQDPVMFDQVVEALKGDSKRWT